MLYLNNKFIKVLNKLNLKYCFMTKKNLIAQIGAPILREKTKEVKLIDISSPKVKKIIKQLITTMRNLNGAGLAANQIFLI